MIVEVQGMGFWTRVRLPPNPLDAVETNCRPTAQIAVFRNVFSVIVPKLKTEKERLVLEAFRHYGLV